MKNWIKRVILLPTSLANSVVLKMHGAESGKACVINGLLRLYGKGKLILGNDVRINSLYRMNPIGGNTFTSIYIRKNAVVSIGDDTGISNAAIYAAQRISIGSRVKIGGSVRIYDTDFHSINAKERAMDADPGVRTSPVMIGDDVFIGAGSIILKGVTIGHRSVVGAGSVVTRNIPDDELWGGAPARMIRKLTPEDSV